MIVTQVVIIESYIFNIQEKRRYFAVLIGTLVYLMEKIPSIQTQILEIDLKYL